MCLAKSGSDFGGLKRMWRLASWSRRGAHLLLQVRTQALNEDLRGKFEEWYPGFNAKSEDQARAA